MNDLILKAAIMVVAAIGILLLFSDFKSSQDENSSYLKKYSGR